jgi:hypothetical protein
MKIGGMGVVAGTPEEVAQLEDYKMPDGKNETVKLKKGQERTPTGAVSLIASELGTLKDGRKALSVITMFPGENSVGGKQIPADRSQFAAQGLYFVIPECFVPRHRVHGGKLSSYIF